MRAEFLVPTVTFFNNHYEVDRDANVRQLDLPLDNRG